MEITFVGHASFLTTAGGVSILCDPWDRSKAFNESWALASPAFAVDYQAVDYIYISHEHPDHFNLPSLKAIPLEQRRRITIILVQQPNRRLIEVFEKLQFRQVLELTPYRWHALNPSVSVFGGHSGAVDSFLAICSPDACVVNLNDCWMPPEKLHGIKRLIGDVALLFTQFSFANWVGNANDEAGETQIKIKEMSERIAILRPRHMIPFASFVYFCNQENARMNAWSNTPEMVQALGFPETQILYPGDRWTSESDFELQGDPITRYRADAARHIIDPSPAPVPETELRAAVQQRLREFKRLLSNQQCQRLPVMTIHLSDIRQLLTIAVADDRYELTPCTPEQGAEARFVMCSQVAWYMLRYPWGTATTHISGMYLDRGYAHEGAHPFFSFGYLVDGTYGLKRGIPDLRQVRFSLAWRRQRFWDWWASKGATPKVQDQQQAIGSKG